MEIIVQAGGRGSRLRHHTWNKPKCLVSVKGKPLLYHLFDQFPNSHFYIIGDYAFEQLETYLKINPPGVQYNLIKTDKKGTSAGIKEALSNIPKDQDILLTWSDLIINNLPTLSETNKLVICTTQAFTCRWSVTDNILSESPGKYGIPGLFYLPNKSLISKLPDSGEFVKWISKNIFDFETLECNDLEELGDFSSIELQNDRAGFSRFFNEVKVYEDRVEKRAIDPNYTQLIENEKSWYKDVSDLGFCRIPKILDADSYTMSKIKGQHPYQITDLTVRERRSVLADYIMSLMSLHLLGKKPANAKEVQEVYIDKTVSRVDSVADIIPNFNHDTITVNGVKCKNVFRNVETFNDILEQLMPKEFTPIHGDPTFSNSLVDNNLKVWYIDPRGYFAKPGIWGDPMYDFAKVYYSAVGGYDTFNRRKFKLHVDNETVEILQESTGFEQVTEEIFADHFGNDFTKIKILHGLIWLALSGYVRDDIDSIIGSFYLGLYHLERGLK